MNATRQVAILTARFGAVLLLLVLVVTFAVTLPTFFTVNNLRSLMIEQAVPGILALGLLVPLIANEFDFSGGAMLSVGGVAAALLVGDAGVPWPVVIALVIAGSGLVGLVNGLLVAQLKYNSFVATLATGGVLAGSALMVTDGQTIYEGIAPGFMQWGQRQVFGVPSSVWYFLLVFVLLTILLTQTPWGRRHAAVGKGRRAAELAGIDIKRHILLAFVVSAVASGFAGVLLVAQLGAAPADVGQPYILVAFAAVFLGGTIFRGNSFNAPGTVIAMILIAVGVNGLSLAGVSSFVGQVFTGVLLLLAVLVSRVEGLADASSRTRRHTGVAAEPPV